VTGRPVISSQYNFAFDSGGNTISVNSAFGISANTGNAYDGVTPLLKAQTSVVPGSTIDVYLTIKDVGDENFDSAVFWTISSGGPTRYCASGQFRKGSSAARREPEIGPADIRVDSNGNGKPDAQDETIGPGARVDEHELHDRHESKWGQSIVEMSNPDSMTGGYQTIIHKRPQAPLAASLGTSGPPLPLRLAPRLRCSPSAASAQC